MTHPPPGSDDDLVPERVRERLLERASQIDASAARVGDLRAAASEAGISQRAFDVALEEMRLTRELRGEKRKRTRGMRLLLTFLVSAGLTILVGSYLIPRSIARPTYSAAPGATAGAGIRQVDYRLGCLTEDQAVALVRPLLRHPQDLIGRSDVEGSLRITGTADLHVEAQRALEAACARPVTTP